MMADFHFPACRTLKIACLSFAAYHGGLCSVTAAATDDFTHRKEIQTAADSRGFREVGIGNAAPASDVAVENGSNGDSPGPETPDRASMRDGKHENAIRWPGAAR